MLSPECCLPTRNSECKLSENLTELLSTVVTDWVKVAEMKNVLDVDRHVICIYINIAFSVLSIYKNRKIFFSSVDIVSHSTLHVFTHPCLALFPLLLENSCSAPLSLLQLPSDLHTPFYWHLRNIKNAWKECCACSLKRLPLKVRALDSHVFEP